MTAPTHVAFSAVLYLYLCTVFRMPLMFGDAFLTALASLLPDLDISSSGIGLRLRPISVRLERKFGHRTFTHSFVGVAAFAILATPLLSVGTSTYLLAVIGFFSHCITSDP